MKKIKVQIQLDIIMLLVSIYFTVDYSRLIMSGTDTIGKKIVLAVWALAVILWTVKLVYDLKRKKKASNN